MVIVLLILCTVLTLTMSSCTLKSTTDTTTDGITDIFSSTTGKTWWTEEGLVKQGQHAGAFVSVNYDNLLKDIAKGEGEYVLAFGKLLNVSSVHQKTFTNQLQRHYQGLSGIKVSQDPITVKQFIHQVVSDTTHSGSPHL